MKKLLLGFYILLIVALVSSGIVSHQKTVQAKEALEQLKAEQAETKTKLQYIEAQNKTLQKEQQQLREKIERLQKEASRGSTERKTRTMNISWYCACVKCCGKSNGITSSGRHVKEGVTMASTLPPGTWVYIDTVGWRRDDDNGVGDGHIDVYVDSHERALQLGRRHLRVYIAGKDADTSTVPEGFN